MSQIERRLDRLKKTKGGCGSAGEVSGPLLGLSCPLPAACCLFGLPAAYCATAIATECPVPVGAAAFMFTSVSRPHPLLLDARSPTSLPLPTYAAPWPPPKPAIKPAAKDK